MPNVLVRLFRGATLPVRMTEGAAGYDLASNNSYKIHSGQEVYIDTDIAMSIPQGYEAQVRPRSSMHKIGLTSLVSPGTIDADYRGTIKIPVRNTSMYDVSIARGQRLAQLVFAKLPDVKLIEVEELPETDRSLDGFGSTGTGSTGPNGTGYAKEHCSFIFSIDEAGTLQETAVPTETLISLMRDIQDETTEEEPVKETVKIALDKIYGDGLDLSHPAMEHKNYYEHGMSEETYQSVMRGLAQSARGETLPLDLSMLADDEDSDEETYVTRQSGFIKADGKKFKLSVFLKKMGDNALALPVLNDALEIIDAAGKTKYAPKNWTKSESPTPFLDAAYRHIERHMQGETEDPETGKAHITHALVNLLFAEALKDKS